jgi:hypothetical protein
VQHLAELAEDLGRAVAIGLVHDEDVRDLQDPRLRHLYRVPQAGRQQDHRGVRRGGHVDLGLAHADRLDHDEVVAGCVEDPHALGRGERHPPEVAAGRHRPDEDVRVRRVLLHPHPVTQERPARVRRGRVDGEDGDAALVGAERADERRGERRLAHPGSSGDADGHGAAGGPVDPGRQPLELGPPVLHQRDRAGDRTAVAREDPANQPLDLHRRLSLPGAGRAPIVSTQRAESSIVRRRTMPK